ncbi:hypothetical protein AVEN_106526-1 [Araneus ventricosus]|uniref:Uncharacterized protein n=1 Tax=Araneus ventricosus TaxID=182803 RepID=A0A4Y2G6D2_ARAVE|nr:hypothetical protein AVEN_106526-1 [Araneus ventricosus]
MESIAFAKERPRWPNGRVTALGTEGSRLETRFHRRSLVYEACCTPNRTQWPNVLPLVWRESLEKGCQFRRRPLHLTAIQNNKIRPSCYL